MNWIECRSCEEGYLAFDNRHFLKFISDTENNAIVGLCLMLFQLDSFGEQKEKDLTIVYGVKYENL